MGKGGGGSKINKDQQDINRLIASVHDDDQEFQEFSIAIPSREEMIKENFTPTEFRARSITWCCNNLYMMFPNKMDAGVDGMEWVYAWNNLYQDKILEHGLYFRLYPKEDQERFVELMLKDINLSKTRMQYKKWKFALHIRERRRLLESTSTSKEAEELKSSREKGTSGEGEESKSSREERTSEEVEESIFRTKIIQFFSEWTPIILQRNDGPGPLLAI